MLKFSELANVGDSIKAFDFKPMEGRDDMFMSGVVLEKGSIYVDYVNGGEKVKVYWGEGYTIRVSGSDDHSKSRIGELGYIPFEVDFMEYDNRITLVSKMEEAA